MDSNRTSDIWAPVAAQEAALQILGPCNIAWNLQILLSGSATALFISYFSGPLYAGDALWTKLTLWAVMLINLASTGVGWSESWDYMVSQRRDFDTLNAYTVADCVAQLPQGMVTALVQIFLVERAVRTFERRSFRLAAQVLLCTIVFLAFAACCCSVAQSFAVAHSVETSAFNVNVTIAIWLWCSAAIDITVTTLLAVKLHRQIMGVRENTDYVIVRLMRLAVATAAPTALFATAGAVVSSVVNARSTSLGDVAMVFISPLPSFYALALVTTLGARERLRVQLIHGPKSHAYPRSGVQGSSESGSPQVGSDGATRMRQAPFSVTVAVELDEIKSEAREQEIEVWEKWAGPNRN